jgi:thiamine-phosphate pyrophosphorylase
LKNCSLCVILDKDALRGKELTKVAGEALRGGARVIQYRDKVSCDSDFIKEAELLRKLTRKYRGILIINDRVDIARAMGADGVHIGQDDMPIKYARKVMGKRIIGVSAHNLKQAFRAQKDGADYIGVGPIFKSPSKPRAKPIGTDILKSIKKSIHIPVFAIGGISLKNIPALKKLGMDSIAVISAAINSGDVYDSVSALKRELESKVK